jgi:hypothetical protein
MPLSQGFSNFLDGDPKNNCLKSGDPLCRCLPTVKITPSIENLGLKSPILSKF